MKIILSLTIICLSTAIFFNSVLAQDIPAVDIETGAVSIEDGESITTVDPEKEQIVVGDGKETIVVDGENILVADSEGVIIVGGCAANTLCGKVLGNIILRVEKNGEAYYINPKKETLHFLGRPADSFSVMRKEGSGISNKDLNKISLGLSDSSGPDTDEDGLSDIFEDAIGTNKNKADTDGDGYEDKSEIIGNYDPNKSGGQKLSTDKNFSNNQKGKIFLQVEGNGEAWYVNPGDSKRYFLGRPADAFSVMRNLGVGISENDFQILNKK